MESKTITTNNDLEVYERLRNNVNMFFNEVDLLVTDDTAFLIKLNNLKAKYIDVIL